MKTNNQTSKVCKLNYSQNLGDIYFMSIFTTLLKLIKNGRTIKILEDKRVRLINLIFCITSKQAVKVPKSKKFCLV